MVRYLSVEYFSWAVLFFHRRRLCQLLQTCSRTRRDCHQQTGHQSKSPTELKVQAGEDSWLQERGFQVGLCQLEGRKVTILSWTVLSYTKERRPLDLYMGGQTASGAKQMQNKTLPREAQVTSGVKAVTRVKSFGKTFGCILCISILNLKYTSDWKKTPGTFYTKGPSIKTLASISSISCTVSQKTVTLLKEKSIYCYPL